MILHPANPHPDSKKPAAWLPVFMMGERVREEVLIRPAPPVQQPAPVAAAPDAPGHARLCR